MQSLIETVVKKLVDKPDEVNVEAVESDQTIIYELTVGDGDYGKVIGKKGRNVSALRTILFAINAKGCFFFLNLIFSKISFVECPLQLAVSQPNSLNFLYIGYKLGCVSEDLVELWRSLLSTIKTIFVNFKAPIIKADSHTDPSCNSPSLNNT